MQLAGAAIAKRAVKWNANVLKIDEGVMIGVDYSRVIGIGRTARKGSLLGMSSLKYGSIGGRLDAKTYLDVSKCVERVRVDDALVVLNVTRLAQ